MRWNEKQREGLFHIINHQWEKLDIDSFESWLLEIGIKWAELKDVDESPPGTVAIWEGPGLDDENAMLCWVVPDDVALKLLVLKGFLCTRTSLV